MNPLLQLEHYGQSYWLDNLTRAMIKRGDLKRRVEERGLRGVTSNPSIFKKAIAGSRDYDGQIEQLVEQGCSTQEVYEALVTTAVGLQHAGPCLGIHLTMPIVAPDPATLHDLSDSEKAMLAGLKKYRAEGSAYARQQGTRPQTLGYGLADSPAGQAAWIVEKYQAWMDCDGHPENVLTRDELLDQVMLYWLPNSATSSARLYWESFAKVSRELVSLPVGISLFPKEIFRCSRRWAEQRFPKLIHFREFDKGGHFAALECPEVLVDEIRTCFRPLRPA